MQYSTGNSAFSVLDVSAAGGQEPPLQRHAFRIAAVMIALGVLWATWAVLA